MAAWGPHGAGDILMQKIKSIALGIFIGFGTVLVAPTGALAATVVASYEPSTLTDLFIITSPGSSFVPAQTFTPSLSGQVSGISVWLREGVGDSPLSVDISLFKTDEHGLPSSPLGTAAILSPSLTSDWAIFEADFTSLNISIFDDQEYAFTMYASGLGDCCVNATGGGGSDEFAGGNFLISFNSGAKWAVTEEIAGKDIAFSVSIVPLPAALPLFGAALAGFGLMGWRKKQYGAGKVSLQA